MYSRIKLLRVLARISALLFINFQAASLCARGQQGADKQPKPTVSVVTNAVLLDVIATDHQGRPLEDLTQNDFQVFERDGSEAADNILFRWTVKPIEQEIAHFELVKTRVPSAFDAFLLPQDKAALALVPVKIPSILLIDSINTDSSEQLTAGNLLLGAVDNLQEGRQIAVLQLTGMGRTIIWQDFTDNHILLKNAIGKATGASPLLEGSSRDDSRSPSNILSDAADRAPSQTTGQKQMQGQQRGLAAFQRGKEKEDEAQTVDRRVEWTLGAMARVAETMMRYQGRKSLIWVSDSFPWDIPPDLTDMNPQYEFRGLRNYDKQAARTSGLLMAARMAVYPIRVRGVEVNHVWEAGFGGGGKPIAKTPFERPGISDAMERDNVARQELIGSMLELADRTGGLPCTNSNDLAGCFGTAVEDGASYYELAYYPHGLKWNGEYRQIVVLCKRKGVTLRYRQGYYARR